MSHIDVVELNYYILGWARLDKKYIYNAYGGKFFQHKFGFITIKSQKW